MTRHLATWTLAAMAVVGCRAGAGPTGAGTDTGAAGGGTAATADGPDGLRVVGPFTHGNLSVFLLAGPAAGETREFLTLDEGLASGQVAITEQGGAQGEDQATVNTLEITNRSGKWVYVEAGEVVRGGKQDRTMGRDLLVAPDVQAQPLAAYCVEHGRWTARGGRGSGQVVLEATTLNFACASVNLPAAAKIALLKEKDQGQVWEAVAKCREENAAQQSGSGTFMDVAESVDVQGRVKPYLEALAAVADAHADAVGCAFARGGEVIGVDVYAHPALFRKLYRKLLDAQARDAALATGEAGVVPAPAAVATFLRAAADGQVQEEAVAAGQAMRTCENGKTIAFEAKEGEKRLHLNVLKK